MDLNAAVADNLNFQIDRTFQETVLQFAQERSSLYNLARTYGLKIPGNRPSVCLCDFSIVVPPFGDKEDEIDSVALRALDGRNLGIFNLPNLYKVMDELIEKKGRTE